MGRYVKTLPTTETIVPLVGPVTTETLVKTPPSCVLTSIAICVLNAVVMSGGEVAVGGAAGITVIETTAVFDTPPGPVARYVKLSAPRNPAFGV